MINEEIKERLEISDPLGFINGLNEEELREFIETVDRYVELRELVDFLSDYIDSERLTTEERVMLEPAYLHFCNESNKLYSKLGYWLV